MSTFTSVDRISGTMRIATALRHDTPVMRATMSIATAFAGAARKDGVADIRGTMRTTTTFAGTTGTAPGRGNVTLQRFTSLGSDYAYSEGRAGFAPFESEGYAGLPEGAYAIGSASMALWAVFGIGLTGGLGQGNMSFKPWGSIGSGHQGADPVYDYSAGIVAFEPFTTFGFDDLVFPDLILSNARIHGRSHVVAPTSLVALRSNATIKKVIRVTAGSSGVISTPVSARGRYHLIAPSSGVVESVATYRGEQGETWLFNTTTYAASRVRGYFFDSLANLDGAIFGTSEAGIFEITGATDNGVKIKGAIIVGRKGSRVPNVKKFSYGYAHGVSDGKLRVRVADDVARVYNYETERALGTVVRSVRFKVGKGLKMHYWQFALENQDGAYFEVEHVDLLPAILERWVK